MSGARTAIVAAGTALLVGLGLAPGAGAAARTPSGCETTQSPRTAPAIRSYDSAPGGIRVFAMQFHQEARHVVSYASFRHKLDCMVRTYVLPYRSHRAPNVVVFNEDIGLMAAGIGPRGAPARRLISDPAHVPGCEGQPFPCATLATLSALGDGYARQRDAYRARFSGLSPLSGVFVASTDTLVRGFLQSFSSLARRYRIYMIGSGDLPRFRASSSVADRARFADPSLSPRPRVAYVATGPHVYNTTYMWGPRLVRRGGPAPLRNVVARNDKLPLTPIELAIGLTAGPAKGRAAIANLRPYRVPGTRIRLGFATSLPAFTYGSPPAGVRPCSDVSLYYMRCLDRLGANTVIQADANPGAWTGPDGDGIERWQPLSWMASTWRAVTDPSVRFAYNVTAMMVGNLADLTFDGQSAITQRGLRDGRRCHYVGNARFVPGEDRPRNRRYAGPKSQFLAIAPWVVADRSRAALRRVGNALAPGSGSRSEDDYVETALVADLPYPPDLHRPSCAVGVARARPLPAPPRGGRG